MVEVTVKVRAEDQRRWAAVENRILRKGAIQGLRKTARETRADLIKMVRRNLATGRRLTGSRSASNLVGTYSVPKRGFDRWPPRTGVFSRATYKRPGGRADLLKVFDEGATITAAGGKWLAIPTAKAPVKSGGRGGLRAATPAESGMRFTFVPISDRLAMLRERRAQYPVYWLVRKVRIRKRINVDRVFRNNAVKLRPNVEAALEAEFRRFAGRGR